MPPDRRSQASTSVDRSASSWYRPSPFEVATSYIAGINDVALDRSRRTPSQALDEVLLPSLTDGPCYLAFSGGVDSSLVLAAATRLARREGLEPPVPVTATSLSVPGTVEDEWQQLVLDHVGLSDWVRLDVTREDDLLGARCTAGLRRNGLVHPRMVHVRSLLFEAASGGVLVTGEGGDEVLGRRRISPVARWLDDEPWRHPRRAIRSVKAVGTRPLAARLRRHVETRTWLRADVREEFARLLVADRSAEPLSPEGGLRWLLGRRGAAAVQSTLRAAAAQQGARIDHPLLDPRFVTSIARWIGVRSALGRAAIIEATFPDLLPTELVRRTDKAVFNRLSFGPETRAFAAEWDGTGLDDRLVDPDELRRAWLREEPPGQTGLLLQAAWLAANGLGLEGTDAPR